MINVLNKVQIKTIDDAGNVDLVVAKINGKLYEFVAAGPGGASDNYPPEWWTDERILVRFNTLNDIAINNDIDWSFETIRVEDNLGGNLMYQTMADQVDDKKVYLSDTDYKTMNDYDGDTTGILESRAEARAFIRLNA